MIIINDKKVVINNSLELKSILENDNSYNYIYFGNDITLDSGIIINKNKEKITIDGTYNDITYTLNGIDSKDPNDTINANMNNKSIIVKNLKVIQPNNYGIIYTPLHSDYKNVYVTYENINFSGSQMSYNPYGTTKIIDCIITIDSDGEEVCESDNVIVKGDTTIISDSANYPIFGFRNNASVTLTFLPNSYCNITSSKKEFINGTYKINFTIMHDAVINLTTFNGFSGSTVHGCRNVLIDERATFNFIETNHKRIPMWMIYNSLTINEGANLLVINTYDSTPTDNYNIHFRGGSPSITLNNPNSIVLYSKNADVLYSDNKLNYSFKASRINMWDNSVDVKTAGSISDIPTYSWYKNEDLLNITGTLTKNVTTITENNLTNEEINLLPNLSNFSFLNKKEFSIGSSYINIDPINKDSTSIKGYTEPLSDVLIKYNDINEIIEADLNGLFSYDITSSINDNTTIEITTNKKNSFIYKTRSITVPFNGEISIVNAPNNIEFSNNSINNNSLIFCKKNEIKIKVIDSRTEDKPWYLYLHLKDEFSSKTHTLPNALIFKKFNNENVTLNTSPSLIYTGVGNNKTTLVNDITWSLDKGLLLDLTNKALNMNEEYNCKVIWSIKEDNS